MGSSTEKEQEMSEMKNTADAEVGRSARPPPFDFPKAPLPPKRRWINAVPWWGFPPIVDNNLVRFTSFFIFLCALTVLVFGVILGNDEVWWLVPFMLCDFFIRTCFGFVPFSPLGMLATALLFLVGKKTMMVPSGAKRFSAFLGILLNAVLTNLRFTLDSELQKGPVIVLTIFSFLESVLGICVGCIMYKYFFIARDKYHLSDCKAKLIPAPGPAKKSSNPVRDTKEPEFNHGYDYDLIVIGGGSGGMAASKEAARLGRKVVVLDYVQPSTQGNTWGLGGTCVNAGCIPKKLYHQAAQLGGQLSERACYGWVSNASEGVKCRQSFKLRVRAKQLRDQGLDRELAEEEALKELADPEMVVIDSDNEADEAEKSCPACPSEASDESAAQPTKSILTPKAASPPTAGLFSRETSCAISQGKLGGTVKGKPLNDGYVTALRSAQVQYLNAFGSFKDSHTVIATFDDHSEMELTGRRIIIAVGGRPRIPNIPGAHEHALSSDDLFHLSKNPGKTIAVRVEEDLELEGLTMIKKHVPTEIIKLKSGRLRVKAKSTRREGDAGSHQDYDTVFFAIGRTPCTKSLNLGNAGVEVAPNGKIHCYHERTTVPHIYAVGDVVQHGLELTPVAIKAGLLLVRRLYVNDPHGHYEYMDYSDVPTTVFTPLEYGSIGLSEEKATEVFGNDQIEVYHSEFTPLEWSIVPSGQERQCYAKVIVNYLEKKGRVIGFHYLGPNAGEVTQGFGVGFKLGMTKDDLDSVIGIHPVCAEEMVTLKNTKRSGMNPRKTGC